MSAQKIGGKQISNPVPLMGKGSYMLLQNKAIKAILKLPFTPFQKQAGVAQAATNYLQ